MEGAGVEITIEEFLAMARRGVLPGWEGNSPIPSSGDEMAPRNDNTLPDWLADVARRDSILQTGVPGALAWLEDIRQIELSLQRRPAPAADEPHPAEATDPLPAAARQQGLDPETGRILDPVADARWQRAQAKRRREELRTRPTISIAEVFLDAQRAIQDWVDAEANKPLVLGGDEEAIRNITSVQDLMRRYEPYGPVMQDKLWKRLFFLVDNRRQYYQAMG
jgi:hypothetical protein